MLQPGDTAPPFRAVDHQGRPVSSADFAGRWVVLWFYPEADTGG